ncbi:hypothetical protein DMB66_05105 [Actinoplanes sp. ATCC 53533]|uniref:DUF4870 domain-containing protein n=1 Tax=Actinoplanes sp. ATCC 53533 TaxID=1288362 RepID=UPI000F77A02C|nr:DUF4870 domain-containing protein [Actinoplanes sp. ATCC 53533]RSM72524.1 hypothetical protein DMB66_05105 [Actinoplanes sp. ATCC 53533]
MGRLSEPSVPEPGADPVSVSAYQWTAAPVPDDISPRRGLSPSRERSWARVAHWGGLVGVLAGALLGWVAPLIVLVTAGRRSAVVRGHALSALNFYLTWAALTVLAGVVSAYTNEEPELVPYLMVWIPLVIGINGAILSSRDDRFRYPTAIRFVR